MTLALYHNPVSTCSQKVRLVLAHKDLDFESHELNLINGDQHRPDYVKLNPNHVVPTLVHDATVLIESTLINEYLEDAFPQQSMRPSAPADCHAMRLWTKLLDEKIQPVIAIVTFAIGPRSAILQQPEEVREANINAIPDPLRRAARRSVLEHGVKAPEFAAALAQMVALLEKLNTELSTGQWLGGERFSLADAAMLPYILRLDALAMTPLIEARTNAADWLARVRALPAYTSAVSNWLPEPLVAMFRANGEAVWDEVRALAAGTGTGTTAGHQNVSNR